MRKRSFIGLLALVLCAAACTGDELSWDEVVGSQADEIVNGSLDTVHQAAVAYLHGSKCSATIIYLSGSTGYALTAGHCIGGALGTIRQGNNHANGQFDVEYPVVAAVAHPEYSGTPTAGHSKLYDFGILRFSGATGSTPVMPALSPGQDNLSQGTQLDLVGYGNTEVGSTTLRRHVVKPISYESDLRLAFNQQTSGMCSGDSGGPVIHNNGQERVAGVNSYISGPVVNQCVGNNFTGTAVRVSAVYDTFIMPVINSTAYGPQTCDQCEEAHIYAGDCTPYLEGCWNNAACSDYLDCVNGCTTQSCVTQCKIVHATGYQTYMQIYTCVCDTACSAECAGDPLCEPPPPCGFTSSNAACQTCWEQNCCAEGNACAADSYCVDCITSITPESGCGSDPEAVAFNGCIKANCADPCNLSTGGGGAGAGGEGGGGVGGSGADIPTGGQGGGVSTSGEGGGSSSGGTDSLVVDQGGCGCTTPGHRGLGSSLWLLALGLAAAAARRRSS